MPSSHIARKKVDVILDAMGVDRDEFWSRAAAPMRSGLPARQLTDEDRAVLQAALDQRISRQEAIRRLGCAQATFYRWLHRHADDTGQEVRPGRPGRFVPRA